MISRYGARRTPKELAAILLADLVAIVGDDWNPDPEITPAEEREVRRQLEAYQERIYGLLGRRPLGQNGEPHWQGVEPPDRTDRLIMGVDGAVGDSVAVGVLMRERADGTLEVLAAAPVEKPAEVRVEGVIDLPLFGGAP